MHLGVDGGNIRAVSRFDLPYFLPIEWSSSGMNKGVIKNSITVMIVRACYIRDPSLFFFSDHIRGSYDLTRNRSVSERFKVCV